MTTYDVCEKIVKKRTEILSKCSYATLLANEPPTTTPKFDSGIANCFVSHAWKYPFKVLIESMKCDALKYKDEEIVLYWLDICAINQHKADELPEMFWHSAFKKCVGYVFYFIFFLPSSLLSLAHFPPISSSHVIKIEILGGHYSSCILGRIRFP